MLSVLPAARHRDPPQAMAMLLSAATPQVQCAQLSLSSRSRSRRPQRGSVAFLIHPLRCVCDAAPPPRMR